MREKEFGAEIIDVNSKNESEQTILHLAAVACNEEEIIRILDLKTDVHVTDSNGITPFLLAAAGGSVQVAEMLLKAYADIDSLMLYI